MIVLDAGVLIALLDQHDAHHATAVALLSEAEPPFFIHQLNLAEVLVGPARAGREQAVWDDLRQIGVEVANLGSNEAMLLARKRAEHRLKMPDTCVLATAEHLGIYLVTFDKQLADVAARLALLHP